jgi:SAM-dependent methyltransferase
LPADAPSAAHVQQVLDGYAADAPRLITTYEALSTETVLAPVGDLVPAPPARVLDVGAGTGRDAAWLSSLGHSVTAAEPVAPLREAGMALHPALRWIDDRLPDLQLLRAAGERFDLILLNGVWQHLPPALHAEGIAALSDLLARGGRLIQSIRHGPGAANRPCYPAVVEDLCAMAEARGLRLRRRRAAASIQQANRDAGITWTWLAFERP